MKEENNEHHPDFYAPKHLRAVLKRIHANRTSAVNSKTPANRFQIRGIQTIALIFETVHSTSRGVHNASGIRSIWEPSQRYGISPNVSDPVKCKGIRRRSKEADALEMLSHNL